MVIRHIDRDHNVTSAVQSQPQSCDFTSNLSFSASHREGAGESGGVTEERPGNCGIGEEGRSQDDENS